MRSDPSPAYHLKILAGDGGSVQRFVLEPGTHVVGSAPTCDVVLAHSGVSRRHARLEVLPDGGVVVTDLESKNGTFLQGRRIRRASAPGWSTLAFGGAEAMLVPTDAAAAQVLLGSPAESQPDPRHPTTNVPRTEALGPVGPLAASLERLAEGLPAGSSAGEAGAVLLKDWLLILPLTRAEILRATAGEDEVIAAASSPRAGRESHTHEVAGESGWKLRLRLAEPRALEPLEPLLRLALALLAAFEAPRAVRVPRRQEDAEAAAEPRAPAVASAMAALYKQVAKVARGDVSVLILGESGVGKEVLARFVHEQSRRARGPFLAVNCAALPRDLLEAELFGIERGVATGVEARPGLLERAAGGTVFLDEIGDMALETQAKVLRVLENTRLYRVGGRAPVEVDVRFVAATNRRLPALVEEKAFRLDLYHRLAAFEVEVPPLRERRPEIPALASHFFHRELRKNGLSSRGIRRPALGALVRYDWPGNVRELENEIAKATLLLEGSEALDLPHLSRRVQQGRGSGAAAASFRFDDAVAAAERQALQVALAAAEGDSARAMELLELPRSTFYRKVKELGLGE